MFSYIYLTQFKESDLFFLCETQFRRNFEVLSVSCLVMALKRLFKMLKKNRDDDL